MYLANDRGSNQQELRREVTSEEDRIVQGETERDLTRA